MLCSKSHFLGATSLKLHEQQFLDPSKANKGTYLFSMYKISYEIEMSVTLLITKCYIGNNDANSIIKR